MSGAYYNEIDKAAAQWLRNLIKAGLIAPGEVDERSIEDIRPEELRGFTQCHFFAGIGVWSYALRRAGWDDSRPVWTGSCPCQPFSAAGKGVGFADERHLWPAWFHLIDELRPSEILGEQVASKDADPWLDLVQTDLEAVGYAVGAIPFPSAGIGAPHIRDRLYWMAGADNSGRQWGRAGKACDGRDKARIEPQRFCNVGWLGNADSQSARRDTGSACGTQIEVDGQGSRDDHRPGHAGGSVLRLADAIVQQRQNGEPGVGDEHAADGWLEGTAAPAGLRDDLRPGPTNGFWRDADWLGCRDGKWRPVEPGFKQMVDGSSASLGRLRAGTIEEIQGDINGWAIRYQADAGKALHDLWGALSAQALRERTPGRLEGIHEPAILLAFLRQLTEQGWSFAQSLSCASTEAAETVLRVLRHDEPLACASRQRGLDGQLVGESPDPMHILSSILARHAQKAWAESYNTHARNNFPLASGERSRTIRLRAYGNAINAQAAEVFIRCVMEAQEAENNTVEMAQEQAA